MTGPEPYTPGEIQRTLTRIEQTVAALAGSVVTKAELQLHMDGLRTQFRVIDDRHNVVVADLAAEKQLRIDAAKERQAEARERAKEVRNFKWGLIAALIVAAASMVFPLMLKGLGAT